MRFVIWAPSFDDRVGGIIALHLLCARLNAIGVPAMLWPDDRPRLQRWRNPRRYLGWARYHLTRRRHRFDHGPFDTALARPEDLRDAVVVYPEAVAGNPLRGRNVVRWLLHRPGFHTGKVEFGSDDLIFFYQPAFNDPPIGDTGGRLTLTWWNRDYFDRGNPDRSGSAYLVKKGAGRPLVHDLTDSVRVDDFSHQQKAKAFNERRVFYTYDPYTLYSRYAAICGCVPVIIPVPGLTREAWVPEAEERYGMAYGVDDIPWAVATRGLMLDRIEQEKAAEEETLRTFVAKCTERFA